MQRWRRPQHVALPPAATGRGPTTFHSVAREAADDGLRQPESLSAGLRCAANRDKCRSGWIGLLPLAVDEQPVYISTRLSRRWLRSISNLVFVVKAVELDPRSVVV